MPYEGEVRWELGDSWPRGDRCSVVPPVQHLWMYFMEPASSGESGVTLARGRTGTLNIARWPGGHRKEVKAADAARLAAQEMRPALPSMPTRRGWLSLRGGTVLRALSQDSTTSQIGGPLSFAASLTAAQPATL